jgi:DNA polymerase I
MTILEENRHSFRIVEHDPMLYEDAGEMVEYLAQASKQTSKESPILLYTRRLWILTCRSITELADRVFCIYSEQTSANGRKAEAKTPRAQATLEAYS